MKNTEQNPAIATDHDYVAVQLDEPLQRGNTVISEIKLRKPKARELLGVSLVDIANLDVVALQKVLPRISTPTLTSVEVSNLELADLLQLGAEVAYFLAKKADRSVIQPMVSPTV